MSFVDDIAIRARQSRAGRYGVIGAMALSAGDLPYPPKTLKQSLRIIGSGSAGARAIKDTLQTLASSIDPRIQSTQLEDLLTAGEAFAGSTPSPFISNPSIITSGDWKKLNQLIEQELLTKEELTNFVNLLGVHYKQQAQIESAHALAPSPKTRMAFAQDHNNGIDPVFFGMVMQILTRNPQLQEKAKKGFTTKDVIHEFPNVSKISVATKWIDDQSDILMDLLAEHKSGRLSTSFVVAQSAQNFGLFNSHTGRLLPYIVDDCRDLLAKNRPIHIRELPKPLQLGIEQTGQQLHELVQPLNPAARKLVHAAWQHGIKTGLTQPKNERTQAAIQQGLQR